MNGTAATIFACAVVAGKSTQLGQGVPFKLFTPTTAGQNYYTQTLQPALQNSCGGCHGAGTFTQSYTTLYYLVANSTLPPFGSTATTNIVVETATNMISHNGGNVCGSASGSPCSLVQTWFNTEFP